MLAFHIAVVQSHREKNCYFQNLEISFEETIARICVLGIHSLFMERHCCQEFAQILINVDVSYIEPTVEMCARQLVNIF